MRRREFIELFGGALMAWPLPASAQQAAVPLIGFLHSASAAGYTPELAAFRDALKEAGFVEGRDVAIEFRWAEDRYDRLPKMAEELVQHRVAVLVAAGGGQSALAAQAATTSIPIVFHNGSDAVRLQLVASLNRPGGNITGITNLGALTALKRLDLVRQAVPGATVIAYLTNPHNPNSENVIREISSAALHLGREVVFLSAADEQDLAAAFATLVERRVGALVVSADPIFMNRVDQVIALASRYSIPTMFPSREHAIAGGLMSYGASYVDTYRQLGSYTARILKGEKPADLPVVQATKFDLVINLKTAKALGLEFPPTLLALADEVIE